MASLSQLRGGRVGLTKKRIQGLGPSSGIARPDAGFFQSGDVPMDISKELQTLKDATATPVNIPPRRRCHGCDRVTVVLQCKTSSCGKALCCVVENGREPCAGFNPPTPFYCPACRRDRGLQQQAVEDLPSLSVTRPEAKMIILSLISKNASNPSHEGLHEGLSKYEDAHASQCLYVKMALEPQDKYSSYREGVSQLLGFLTACVPCAPYATVVVSSDVSGDDGNIFYGKTVNGRRLTANLRKVLEVFTAPLRSLSSVNTVKGLVLCTRGSKISSALHEELQAVIESDGYAYVLLFFGSDAGLSGLDASIISLITGVQDHGTTKMSPDELSAIVVDAFGRDVVLQDRCIMFIQKRNNDASTRIMVHSKPRNNVWARADVHCACGGTFTVLNNPKDALTGKGYRHWLWLKCNHCWDRRSGKAL